MAYEIRPITPEELPEFLRVDVAAFGHEITPESVERWRTVFEFDRSLAAFDEGMVVGTAGAYAFELTLPGRTTLPVAGVSYVSVRADYRRRGILASMKRRQLDDIRERGEAVAVLTASESAIYRRFGYGAATYSASFEIDRRDARLAVTPRDDGRIRQLDREEAMTRVFPAVYDRVCAAQPGMLTRNEGYWRRVFWPNSGPQGYGARFCVAHEDSGGQADGFAYYRVKQEWENGIPKHLLLIGELYGLNPEARAALWRYCLTMDLAQTIRMHLRPLDEPLRHMLADPRRLHVAAQFDGLWVRLLNVPAALAARRYAAPGRLVLEVSDPFCPRNSDRYLLEGGPEGAECRATTEEPDLALDVAELGAAYLGGTRFRTLAQAGRVEERAPGALARADALFASDPPPWCSQEF